MPSWRDTASPQAQADMDELLNAAIPFAQEQLAKHGELYPYGAAITTDGDIKLLGAHSGTENPRSQTVIDTLIKGAAQELSRLRAVALVADVRVSSGGGDAVRVELEHREGLALTVLLPYVKRSFGRGIQFQQMSAAQGVRRFWPAPTDRPS